ncbi:GntP family permease [Brachybacterium saurashtrense]|uniref:GntP family permease n=1 Tax=Brachybacterium saurashtrense TaxID=556288 RepID=A0A345YPQ5_9MICO|nr:GntP family permease [Brachybacterium saurashtrense]AXK45907.1 GntP family permease [Brachybacterium saurashtrense]RRR23645.1 GntP family permease [Brachybacterium saurashtrense]
MDELDLVMNWELGTGGLLVLAASAVAVLLVMIMALRVHAFIALMITSIGTALAAGIAPASLMDALRFGFDSTLGNVMLLVALGAMLGRMIETSGGAQLLADRMIEVVGEKRAGLGLSLASLLMGFPIFFDAGLVVMLPIIYAVARRVGGSFLSIALPSAVAFSAMHIFAPPHPGPVAASSIVGADIGLVMLVGLVFAVVIWYLVGVLLAPRLGMRFDVPIPTLLDSTSEKTGFESSPRLGTILGLLALPLVLILLNTGLNTLGSAREDTEAFLSDPLVSGLRLLGETPIALLITVAVSMVVLGWGAGKKGTLIEKITDSALGPICSVVLVTGAGGMFGGVLRVTGIGDAVAGSLNEVGMPVIVAAFLIAQIVRIAQGSATVALTTAASLMVGVIAAGDFTQLQIVAIVMAMSAGSVGFSHVNDSGFWLVSRFFGMDMKQTLSTWTVIQGAMAIVGFVLSVLLYAAASVLA